MPEAERNLSFITW